MTSAARGQAGPGGEAVAASELAANDELLVSLYQKQAKIYPRAVTGVFARWRWTMVWITQLVFYGLPWLSWNGRQAVLFDLGERRFFVFGLVLQPQELIYLAALLVLAALMLFFFTALAGRLWCGYACPQTVYTEIFLWFERRLEGDRRARMALDAAPWSAQKVARKGSKQAVWILFSAVTGFTFVGYFTPIRELLAATLGFSLGPWEWFWILFYGLATYGNAGHLREQVCKYMCPYARFQSALIDGDSLVIAYDVARGDPRGSRSRKADARQLGLGDCIDCTLCVQVCPTGIDIRKGLQNECIGCAACIDVCDDVMSKMGYPQGLIRYATGHGMANGWTRRQMWARVSRPRVWIYAGLLSLLCLALAASLVWRKEFSVNIIRDRGALSRVVEDGGIENVYTLKVTNRTEWTRHYRVSASGLPAVRLTGDSRMVVEPHGIGTLAVRLQVDAAQASALGPGAHPVAFVVEAESGSTGAGSGPAASANVPAPVRESSTFYVPR